MVQYAPAARHKDAPLLLNDVQVSRFITDGYLRLDAQVPAEVHHAAYQRLQWVLHEEGNPGNNVLPAVPEMQQVLDSPVIRGALESLLGPNYVLHPHRYCHNNEPGERTAEGARMGKGSHSFIGWHQDDHSPLSRPRHHAPRYAMLLYYPQDTPEVMGPTQIIPATHRHRALSDADRERGFQASGAAGTCLLVHFDLAHGGSLNVGDRTRHMVKFVFTRVEEPVAPSWDCCRTAWETPAGHQSPYESPVVWSSLWNWMSGRPASGSFSLPDGEGPDSLADLLEIAQCEGETAARVAAINRLAARRDAAEKVVPALMAAMEGEEFARQSALYALAALGSPAVRPLCNDLAGRTESRWSESVTVMENSAYALAALGAEAVPALMELLENPNEWVQINAIFALGEMGKAAQNVRAALIAKLDHPSHSIVRTALDALGQIGAEERAALPALRRLLMEPNSDWQTVIMREWNAQDQVRFNAMTALLRLGWNSDATTALLADSLGDPCGYVTGLAIECLLRQNTPTSLKVALHALCAHRWDETLKRGVRTY